MISNSFRLRLHLQIDLRPLSYLRLVKGLISVSVGLSVHNVPMLLFDLMIELLLVFDENLITHEDHYELFTGDVFLNSNLLGSDHFHQQSDIFLFSQ